MLTGRVPFEGDSAVTIALKHVSETPVAAALAQPGGAARARRRRHARAAKGPGRALRRRREFIAALECAREGVAAVPVGQATAAFAPPPVPPTDR